MVYDLISSPEFAIPYSSFAATSVLLQNPNYGASRSRLNLHGAWYPDVDDDQKRITVDFRENRLVLSIRTRILGDPNSNINSFVIYTGVDDLASLNPVRDSSDEVVVYDNVNATGIVNHPLPMPIIARYVGLQIVSFDGMYPGINWAIDGCAVPNE